MKVVLCNEVLRGMEFAAQCDYAAALGFDGLELAPFTLGNEPHLLTPETQVRLRRAATDAGIEIVSLHWLLTTPEGLSITSANDALRKRSIDVMRRLIDLCAAIGGHVLVHGSPAQRQLPDDDPATAIARGQDSFAAIAADAEAAGVTYCIEPLSRQETTFITSVKEAVDLVEAIGSSAVRTMVDCRAARASEEEPVADLLDRWLPTGMIGHVHLNDSNRRAPGQGDDLFAPVLASLLRNEYAGAISIEPFIYEPDGPAVAARAAGYVRGILETLTWRNKTACVT